MAITGDTDSGALPIPQVPPAAPSIAASSSGDGTAIIAKNTLADVSFRHNAANPNAAILDNVARQYGVAILSGLTLSVPGSGLNLPIAAGKAMIGGPVEYAGGNLALPNGQPQILVWMQQNGVPTYTLTPTPPATASAFIGSAATSGGNVTDVDTSGVVYLRAGVLYRKTADLGAPGDAPPATIVLLTETASGTWLWNGIAHLRVGAPQFGRVSIALADANTTLTGDQYGNEILEFTGTLTAGRNIIVPLTSGMRWIVFNGTTGGFALTVKGATGSGVAIAAGKRAMIYGDGTNIVRASADV